MIRRKRASQGDAVDAALDTVRPVTKSTAPSSTTSRSTVRLCGRARAPDFGAPGGWRPDRPFAQQRQLKRRAGNGEFGQSGAAERSRLHSDILIRMSSAANRVCDRGAAVEHGNVADRHDRRRQSLDLRAARDQQPVPGFGFKSFRDAFARNGTGIPTTSATTATATMVAHADGRDPGGLDAGRRPGANARKRAKSLQPMAAKPRACALPDAAHRTTPIAMPEAANEASVRRGEATAPADAVSTSVIKRSHVMAARSMRNAHGKAGCRAKHPVQRQPGIYQKLAVMSRRLMGCRLWRRGMDFLPHRRS